MQTETQEEEKDFEAQVLRIARALYTSPRTFQPFQGSAYLGTSERDGIFVSADSVVYVEATVSRKKRKAEIDGRKLEEGCARLAREHPFKAIKGFFVTRDEPHADQRRVINALSGPIVACSFQQFQGLLVDVRGYLDARDNYAFGSARNPATIAGDGPLDEYIPVDLWVGGTNEKWSVDTVARSIASGGTVVIDGDYGAGKSMTTREVFKKLSANYRRKETYSFPILLNLRDHQAQSDPIEAIERHSAKIGFESGSHLVRAWRAGHAHILLDGFDEIATPGWLGRTTELRQIRRASVELIRQFVQQRNCDSGLYICGRSHFFDSPEEMRDSLRLNEDSKSLRVSDFSDQQLADYLTGRGVSASIPDWLPARPLLVAYLTSRSLVPLLPGAANMSASEGWDALIDLISTREAELERFVDGALIRRILENLASRARYVGSGLGPLSAEHLTAAFKECCGYSPDEGSYMLLQRLPGLGVQDLTDGMRYFVDATLADALRAGDVARLVTEPGASSPIKDPASCNLGLDELGVEIVSTRLAQHGVKPTQAFGVAKTLQGRGFSDFVVSDLARTAIDLGDREDWDWTANPLSLSDIWISRLSIGGVPQWRVVQFSNSMFDLLDLTSFEAGDGCPTFVNCNFGEVSGVASPHGLPEERFFECSFDAFDISTQTTNGILGIPNLTPKQRVALTILKKLYVQRGSGRRETAFIRGLDTSLKTYVREVLHEIQAENLAGTIRVGGRAIFTRTRGQGRRVQSILAAPAASNDPLMVRLSHVPRTT